jgi:hypothetical protein
LRFAFYGRISTAEYQDAVSSRAWQVESAQRVVAGPGSDRGGVLRLRGVAEFALA